MKKITKKLIKLIDFIIKVLNRCVKTAIKVCNEYEKAGDKVQAIAGVVIEIGEIIQTLEEKKKQIEQLNEE